MKKLLFLLTVALAALSIAAAPVSQSAAKQKAQSYLANELYAGKIMAPAALQPVLIKTEIGNPKLNLPVYYIFNTSTTFLVIAGDDRAEDILMIGDEPLDLDRIPDGMQYLLDCYKEQIEYLQMRPNLQVAKRLPNTSLRAQTYGPLLQSKWSQGAPYNRQCSFTYNNKTYNCVTGCPATSAAMVMHYWKYPEGVPAMASYNGFLDINTDPYGDENYVSFTYPSLPAVTFDWVNMKNTYGYNYTTAQANAVATLMRYIGQAEQMEYGVLGSGISTADAAIIATMFKNWGYKSTARLAKKTSYSATNWNNLIIGEMAASRPVVYLGVDQTQGGHAFNVDGYRDSDGKFHVNFGWSGSGDNWFAMNSFTDPDGATFNLNQMAIVGIEAPNGIVETPELAVDPTSLNFDNTPVGQTASQTVTITGTNLVNDVTLSTSNALYTVTPSTLTKAQANVGATVTVTYAPTAAGTNTATLTVASVGALEQTVSLKGTAVIVPTITVDPTSLDFETNVGTAVQKTFRVTGANLNGVISLTCSGTGYSINKTTIIRTAAANGVDVTVTYNPASAGTHPGTVTLRSSGAEDVIVTLNGSATGSPTITANPTSLSFSTSVGTPVTKSFSVSGVELTGNVTLAVSGTGYTINKTTITKEQAAAGTTVNVTYNPTVGGTHTGTVTLSSPGAQTVTVSLNGTSAALPSMTVNPTSLSMTTVVGTPVTKTFTVTGANLTGNVNLTVSGTDFAIDKTSVTQSAAANGATVTVTYNPTAAGTHTGTVTLSSNGAQSVTVALSGTATEPVRAIHVNPSSLNLSALTGETATATFNVSGENLTGDLALALTDANGVYSIEPTIITAAAAMAGNVPVTVTYSPTTYGPQNGVVTITGGGAPAATVALRGTATLAKYVPVMLPAVQDFINQTKFRADWTDATPEANVESYTLEVTPKSTTIPVELLGTLDGSAYPNGYVDITLSAPWGGTNVRGGYSAIYFRNNYQGANSPGNITFTVPAGYNNAPFTMKITTVDSESGVGNLAVATPQTAAVNHSFTQNSTYSWVVTASTGDQITVTTTDNNYSPDIARIEVYSGDANAAAMLKAISETGDENSRTIIGITNKYYTVENLAANGTFLYRVKTMFADGTESDWSNVEEVTLFENGHPYVVGDVNHDNDVNITDVIVLINELTSGSAGVCQICADFNQDNEVNISDVIAMISFIQGTRTR